MLRPAAFALACLGIAVLWQVLLWKALPNVGMHGLAAMYLVWPLLALSAICLWFVLKRVVDCRPAIFSWH